MAIEPVIAEALVPLPRVTAFDLFTRRIDEWWPLAFTMSGHRIATIGFEIGDNPRWFERDLDGKETSWGELRAWGPPAGFTAAFAVSPQRTLEPPERCSEVSVAFEPDGPHTRVLIDHHDWERHGEGAGMMRDGMAGPQGWPVILAEYLRAAGRELAA